MDDRLGKAIEFANFRVSFFNSKENIKLKTDTMLGYSINGGTFKATPELIAFTKIWVDKNAETLVIIDNNGNPIEILDISEFYEELLSRYFEATNFYYVEYNKLKKIRTVEKLFNEAFDE